MRILGCRRSAEQAFPFVEDKDSLKAYADGINDYVQSVTYALFDENISAMFLPIEFFVFDINK